MSIVLVVAYNKNFVIGDGEKIPWHIPEEMKFFKEYTTGKTCIMGRKTWDSIPKKHKPLKNRYNIVVTRCIKNMQTIDLAKNNFYYVQSIEQGIEKSLEIYPNNEICIIGGGEIYNYCLENNIADKVVASEIKTHKDVVGEVCFPDLKNLDWVRRVIKNYDEFEVVEYYKSEPIIQKDFIDPSSIVFVNQFVVQPVAKSILGWVGLQGFKYYWEKIKVFYRNKNGKSSSQGISGS